jgi:hypothetical protein
MAAKLSGAEFKAFLHDREVWPNDNHWMEDEAISIDGGEEGELPGEIADNSVVVVHCGTIRRPKGDDDALVATIRKWRKRQTTVFLVVQVDKSKETAVRDAINAAGGKIVD